MHPHSHTNELTLRYYSYVSSMSVLLQFVVVLH